MANLLSDQVNEKEISIIIDNLNKVIKNEIAGDVVELGCYVGTTSVFLAKTLQKTDKKLYVYDSFEGLPEKSTEDDSPLGNQFKKGELSASKKQFIKNIKNANVAMPVIKKAWFSDLTPRDIPNKISFAFLDGDYYESIRQSLLLVEKNMVPGSIMIVDDYSNEELPGVARAVDGWLLKNNYKKIVEQSLAVIQF